MSLQELDSLYKNLKEIRDYLIKIGPHRRQCSETAQIKFKEANDLFSRLEYISSDIKLKIQNSEISSDYSTRINNCIEDIHILYEKILVLSKDIGPSVEIMATNFDLKTALALLPIMTAQESVIIQLIDSIQLYSGMLNEEGKKQLVNFVLKTRISSSAKLRLKSSYSNVDLMIKDMRTHLLQKKSAVAIQSQLHSASQGRRTIDKFGSELEQLFVNLTIAQADGDDTKFDILRPLNEKIAIKRFADGLTDSRLSTIIASRQFQSLPEAIQTALDESSLSPKVEQVMNVIPHRGNGNNRRFHSRRTYPSNRNSSANNYYYQAPQRGTNNNRTFYNSYRGQPSRGSSHGRYQRGTQRTQFGPPRTKSNPVHIVSQVQPENMENVERNQSSPKSEFFRSYN